MNILQEIDKSLTMQYKQENINVYSEAMAGMVPIYVILTSGTSIVSKMIMTVTKSKYSHCTLCLNYYETISMGTTAKNFGLAIESIFEFPDRYRNGDMKICRRFVPEAVFASMTKKVESYRRMFKKIDYSFAKMTTFFKWTPKRQIKSYKNETSFLCSEFVSLILSSLSDFDYMLKKKNVKEKRGSKYMLSPREIEQSIMNTFETIYEGSVYKMPISFMYDVDKKYVAIKNKITKNVLADMGVSDIKKKLSKSYALNYENDNATEYSIDILDEKIKTIEQNSISELLNKNLYLD